MIVTKACAAQQAVEPLIPYNFERRKRGTRSKSK
jgi:hypothetical protein